MRLILGIFFVAVLAACQQSQAPVAGNASRFEVFATREKAASWFTDYDAKFLANLHRREKPFALVPFSDKRYAMAETALSHLFDAFEKHYPDKTPRLAVPHVLIVNDESVNAFALQQDYFDKEGRIPFFLVIHSGLLKETVSESELYGILGHELSHLILLHGDPKTGDGLRKFYRVASGQEPLGTLQENNPELQQNVQRLLQLADQVGPFTLPELNGLPFGGHERYFAWMHDLTERAATVEKTKSAATKEKNADEKIPKPFSLGDSVVSFLNAMGSKPAAAQAPEKTYPCQEAAERLERWSGYLNHLRGAQFPLDHHIEVPTEAAKQLSEETAAYSAAMEKCLPGKIDLIDTFSQMYKIDRARMAKEIDPEDVKVYNAAGGTAMNGLRAIVSQKQAEMAQITQAIDLPNVRYYSREEEADDYSVRLLKYLRTDQPKLNLDADGQAKWIFNWSLNRENGERKQCEKILSEGKLPPYGMLSDEHHSNCYRIYHLRAFLQYLDAGGN